MAALKPACWISGGEVEADAQSRYISYLLRLWRASGVGQPMWRVSIEDPHSGERRGFADLDSFFAFLKAQITSRNQEASHKQEKKGKHSL
jgi:hypothetical protein